VTGSKVSFIEPVTVSSHIPRDNGEAMCTQRTLRSLFATGLVFLLVTFARADYIYTLIDDADGGTKISVSLKSSQAPVNNRVTGKGTVYIERKKDPVLKKILSGASVDMTIDVASTSYRTSGSDTYYRITGGWFTLDADVDEKDPLKIGLGIKLPKDTKFSAEAINNSDDRYAKIEPPVGKTFDLTFPFMKSDPGGPSKLTASTDSLTIDKNGVAGSGQVKFENVHLAGVSLLQADLKWSVSPAGDVEELTFTAPSVSVAMDIPGTTPVDSNKLIVTATDLKIDQDGEFSFRKVTAAPSPAVRIDLANPANFAIVVKSLEINMDVQTKEVDDITLKFDLELPPQFRLGTGNSNAPIKITDIEISASPEANNGEAGAPFSLVKTIKQKINPKFGDFTLTIDEFEVDLDPNAGTNGGSPAWMGIHIPTAKLEFSSELQKSSTAKAELTVTNLSIGSAGVDGKVTGATADLANFKAPFFKKGSLDTLSLEFLKGQLVSFDATGKVNVQELGGDVKVQITVTGAGVYTLKVDPEQKVNLGAFGNAIQMQIDDGTYTYDSQQNKHKLKISGVFAFSESLTGELDNLRGLKFGFQDLAVDGDGKFALGGTNVDLPNPVSIPLGPAKVEIAQFGIVSVAKNGQNYPGIMLTGEVSVEDLPVSGTIGFDGITVYYEGSTSAPINLSNLKADWKKIDLDLSVAKVGRLTASLEKGQYPDPAKGDPAPAVWNGLTPVTVIRGDASLTLECFGPGSSPIEVAFMAAPNAWFVSAALPLPTPITLGSTGLEISVFRGGLGRNVTSPTGDSGMVGVPVQDYPLVPLPPTLAANTPNYERKWLFTAGVRIQTLDKKTMWGDLNLTAGIGQENFFIDLDGKFYFYEDVRNDIATTYNRRLLVNLHYNSTENSFKAYAQADLYFKDRGSPVLYAYAPVELFLSPDWKYFRIGGDVKQNTGGPPTFTNPATIQLLGGKIGGNGVFLIDLDQRTKEPKLTMKGGALVWYNASFSFDITSKISVEGWIKANGYVYFDGYFSGDPNGSQALKFERANAQVGFGVSIGGKLVNPIKDLNFTASADADLSGSLDSDFKATLTGTLSGKISVGRFNPSFRTGFTIN
jgi:hypothetical protein